MKCNSYSNWSHNLRINLGKKQRCTPFHSIGFPNKMLISLHCIPLLIIPPPPLPVFSFPYNSFPSAECSFHSLIETTTKRFEDTHRHKVVQAKLGVLGQYKTPCSTECLNTSIQLNQSKYPRVSAFSFFQNTKEKLHKIPILLSTKGTHLENQ